MKSFSELTSASQVNNGDLLAISQASGSGYASKKTTVKDITDKSNLNLAEKYDSTSTYAVDDYVIYESVLYKCIGTTTGTFDSTKWTSVVVTDEMGSGGGGTGGHTIIDENGNSMTARAGLQFVGGANVSDDSTNNKTIVDLASAGGIDGVFIDTNNVIVPTTAISTSGLSYTATEDCFAYVYLWGGNSTKIKINNVEVGANYSSDKDVFLIHLKKGQTLTTTSGNENNTYTVYGIQTGTTHSKFQPVIYSTEEREIGVWTDGKPLYQKSIHITNLVMDDSFNDAMAIPNLDTLVASFGQFTRDNPNGLQYSFDGGIRPEAGSINASVSVRYYNGYIQYSISSMSYTDIIGLWVHIRYTKTTDVAGSGTWTPQGVPTHHYSTDEQIIGTWIDGKTLYEKTISSDLTLSTESWQNYTSLANLNLLSVDKVIITRDGEQVPMAFSPYMIVAWIVRDNYLKFIIQSSTSVAETIVLKSCTIQYTKSS